MKKKFFNKTVLKPQAVLANQRQINAAGRKGLYPQGMLDALKANPTGNICVIRSVGGIGDVLMITPGLRELKRRFPNCKLTFAIDRHTTHNDIYYELIKNAPFIDECYDARYVDKRKYTKCIDISAVSIPYEREGLPARNRIDIFANSLGLVTMENRLPFYCVEPEEKAIAKSFINEHLGFAQPLVGIHTASNEDKRTWRVHQQVKFIKTFSAKASGAKFLIFDHHNMYDWSTLPNVVVTRNESLREMASLINEVDLFICPDSGPMHIAGALGKKSLTVFGSIPPEARINHYPSHTSVRMEELSCLGCWYRDCPYDVKCMRDLDGGLVASKALIRLR